MKLPRRIRALGAGMAERIRALPTLATLQEQGLKGFECYTWNAILAPANTPRSFIVRLSNAINQPSTILRYSSACKKLALIRRPDQPQTALPSSSRRSLRNGLQSSRLLEHSWTDSHV